MKFNFNTEAHYFVPLRPLHDYGFVSYVNRNDPAELVECELHPYEFGGYDYKLRAVPVNPDLDGVFAQETFYSEDFNGFVKSGIIIEKTNDDMRVERVRMAEPVSAGAYIIHEFSAVIGG